MQLRHINIRALIAEAGGDPWAIEHSLHAGRPAQIAELAEAFRPRPPTRIIRPR